MRTAVQGENIEIAESTLANIEAANQRLNRIARSGKAVYGINTDLNFYQQEHHQWRNPATKQKFNHKSRRYKWSELDELHCQGSHVHTLSAASKRIF